MQKGYIGADKALAYLFDNASEVSAAQTLTQGTEIARITIDGQVLILYAPTPPNISASAVYRSGTKIGEITINNQTLELYTPDVESLTAAQKTTLKGLLN